MTDHRTPRRSLARVTVVAADFRGRAGWLSAFSVDASNFTVAPTMPSLSRMGVTLLGGLLAAIAVGGLAVQHRRRAA